MRAHAGLLLVMRDQTLDGPYCATCGNARIRAMTTRTLWQGWWNPLSLVLGAPLTLCQNWSSYRQLRRLPPPVPVPGRQQTSLGRPVLRRPQAYVALLPLITATWLITSAVTH